MSESTNHVYPKAAAGEQSANVAPNPSFPKLEESVLDYWDKDNTFQKSIDRRPSGDHSQNEFVFFDGPPFANGLPHYGHLLTGYAKDVIPRYQTMKGHKVNRVFGWDTHGLPAELEAQKELGIDSVDQVKEMGIDKFNDACRASVLKYTNEWKAYVHRQARWVDFEHGYKTLNITYMESVMWAFKQLYDKGLRVVLYFCGFLTCALLVLIIGYIFYRGLPHVTWNLISTKPSYLSDNIGILPDILNTLYIVIATLVIVLPLGVGAAIYLTEYARNRKLVTVIEFATETLTGIPSIIYGLVGMMVFLQLMGLKAGILAGGLTLVVMILPTIVRTTQESLKTVPQSYREGSLALGAGKWHMVRTVVLPNAVDGIVTGCILAVGRIVGESAALLFTAGAAEVIAKSVAKAYTSNGATLSVLLYLRAFEDGDFASAWGIGAVLLVLVLAINLAARLAKTKLKQKQ